MMLKKSITLFFTLLALSLLSYAVLSLEPSLLWRLIALDIAITILFALFYPQLRGVRKGDKVVVVAGSYMPSSLGKVGTLVEIRGEEVRVRLANGSEVRGVLETLEGMFTLPRVRIIYEERVLK
ncbi:MAG: hypothetical protein D6769_01975 [Methanobacteriota archaeon]|nr:MAG: hypothetical protein D6769_01975 [Euryarchaeota archaeon]